MAGSLLCKNTEPKHTPAKKQGEFWLSILIQHPSYSSPLCLLFDPSSHSHPPCLLLFKHTGYGPPTARIRPQTHRHVGQIYPGSLQSLLVTMAGPTKLNTAVQNVFGY